MGIDPFLLVLPGNFDLDLVLCFLKDYLRFSDMEAEPDSVLSCCAAIIGLLLLSTNLIFNNSH